MHRQRSFYHLALVILIITQISCQFASNLIPGGSGGSGYFYDAENPIDINLSLDSQTAAAVIPVEGGELTATGSDGTRYKLTIPAGALLQPIEIRMTPVTSISGLPFSGGLGGAVQLEPSGLAFYEFVTLSIELANPIPFENQIMFGFEEDGKDLHLAIPGDDPNAIQIRLLHFSGAGVAGGSSDERVGLLQRMADRVEARLTNRFGEYLQKQRQGQDPDPAEIEAIFEDYYNSVVIPRLKAASASGASCGDAEAAMKTYLGWERMRQMLGAGMEDNKMELVMANYFPNMAKKCLDEEFERCSVQHQIAGMLPMILGFQRHGELLGAFSSSDPSKDDPNWVEIRQYGEDLLRRCFQWDLEFESAGTFEDDGVGYESRVKTTVPIRVQGNIYEFKFGGKSVLENLDFTFHLNECSVESKTGGGDFTADSLGWVSELRQDADGQDRFFVKDFSLKYNPGLTSESFSVSCPGSPTITPPQSNFWNSLFIVTHYQEADQGNGSVPSFTTFDLGSVSTAEIQAYVAQNWQTSETELMATKEWEGVSAITPTVFEGGNFKLYHRPQK